ncbi:MAG: EVE domain-containing protein [Pseudomonadota bacterium]
MAKWLLKSEPDAWSWDQQVSKGTEFWNGVRNHQAALNLKHMAVGDQAFFYHSNIGREIVGIVTITQAATLDPTDPKGRFVGVHVTADKPLPRAVTLEQIKKTPALQDIALIRQSRLSVMPISDAHWNMLCSMGGM